MPEASLNFLPWVREGAAAAITTVDTLSSQLPGAVDLTTTIRVNDQQVPAISVRLRGPADVLGIDRNQILRTDPRPHAQDFESNCFPSIEFDAADLPWLFTPARANASSKLRPWLCLIVVRKQEGVTLSNKGDTPLPTLQIAAPAKPFVELPNLQDSWAWAHSQTAASSNTSNAVAGALDGASELSLSRLVCPRILEPETDYIACVVPAFELGRKTGLGLPVDEGDLTPAWSLTATTPTQVLLPVYYHWSFRTGAGGDFEALARALKRGEPADLGRRLINISRPGFALPSHFPPDFTVPMEGALQPLRAQPLIWWTSSLYAGMFSEALHEIINAPLSPQLGNPNNDPLLAPPLYGRWHMGRPTVVPGDTWFDIVNLVPQWRAVAAIGTRVIQEHQEALMASAWEQAAEVQHVNQRMRQLQMSLAVGERLHARHLSVLSEEMTLRVAAPAFARIRIPSSSPAGRTLAARVMESKVPVSAMHAAMRKIGRQRGPLTRRISAQGFTRSPIETWIAALNRDVLVPRRPNPTVPDYAQLIELPSATSVGTVTWKHGFRITADGQPMAPIPAGNALPSDWDFPGFFRSAAKTHLQRIRGRPSSLPTPRQRLTDAVSIVRAQMNPRLTLAALARATISTGDNVLPPTASGVTAVGVESVMMTPSFTQPMYEPLRDLSQDLLLPGLHTVKPNTVLGLKTNRMFVDAYMLGLNFEMAREFLWRGFPTDQQGTYFKHFWSYDTPRTVSDIDALTRWRRRSLGAARTGGSAEQFVLLLRSDLLRRYPNALVYLTPAVNNPDNPNLPQDVLPIFSGSIEPDVSFLGFPITPEAAIGGGSNRGYYVVIQEHPTEPRFGVDAGIAANGASHLAIGAQPPAGMPLRGFQWGRNSAHMAGITRRLPMRIAIHASKLVSSS